MECTESTRFHEQDSCRTTSDGDHSCSALAWSSTTIRSTIFYCWKLKCRGQIINTGRRKNGLDHLNNQDSRISSLTWYSWLHCRPFCHSATTTCWKWPPNTWSIILKIYMLRSIWENDEDESYSFFIAETFKSDGPLISLSQFEKVSLRKLKS